MSFYENATAGNASFTNMGGFGGAVTWFFDSSTAGNATFYNFTRGDGFNDGVTVFEDDATAGTATIFCEGGGAVFHKRSSANTGALPISGTFTNLPNGSRFTAGNNTFQASYEGGDGNDLTVTVVP